MRVNIYAEEISERIEIVEKYADGRTFTGVRFYLELPVSVGSATVKGPFQHRPGDDDSAAVTFWGRRETLAALLKAVELLKPKPIDTTNLYGFTIEDTAVEEKLR